MNELEETRETLQETMNFLGALAAGIEEMVGRPSSAMAYVAGKKLGRQFSKEAPKTDDLDAALVSVREVLADNHFHWNYEPFKPVARDEMVTVDEEGNIEVMLVFRDCMIRQALFCYGHPQQQSMCTMMYGFFAGALETIMGRKAELEIVHAGENACLKRLRVLA